MNISKAVSLTDFQAVSELRQRCSLDLVNRYGDGHWKTWPSVDKLLRISSGGSDVFVMTENSEVRATFTFSRVGPFFLRPEYFACPEHVAHYMTDLAVDPQYQRKGLGSRCLRFVESISFPSVQAIRFDAYDAPAGAAAFYEASGYGLVCRIEFKGVPLILFEKTN